MADQKITELSSLATVATNDVFAVIDIDDLTDGTDGSSKKIALSELLGTSTVTFTNKTIDADNNTISNLAHGAEVDNTTTSHGATGAVVGTTNSQTLTNKTLTSPTITTGVIATSLDMNGTKLILDANANTSITADTDDQIDIEISGADDFRFTANKFLVLSGSNIDMNGQKLILDANANTSITADTDDQIDIEISGADDFKFTANTFEALSGSDILIANNESYQAKQAGGSIKDLMKLGTDDILRLSQVSVQDDTTDSVTENLIIQCGWGYIAGSVAASLTKAVTFDTPIANADMKAIIVTSLGNDASPATTDMSELITSNSIGTSRALPITAGGNITGFTAQLSRTDGSNHASGTNYGFSWIAIGVKA